jgi:hypothetical protein
MSEKSILVDLDIEIGGDNVTASVKNYRADVVPDMRIIWNVTIKWSAPSTVPNGQVYIEIPGFQAIGTNTPDKLFADYTGQPIPMEKVAGKEEVTVLFGSPLVHPDSPPPTPPFLWEWEYDFKIWDDQGVQAYHFKIDPLVVISG